MLLDTCVLSELQRPRPDPNVLAWFDEAPEDQLFISVLTLGEIEKGASRLPRGPKRRRIEEWLAELHRDFGDRVLAVDDAVARRWGRLAAAAERSGYALSVVDGLIAATAQQHGMAVVTRNTRDFAHTGIRCINPWQEPSAPARRPRRSAE